MAIKTMLFMVGFIAACGGALYAPLIGVVAYVLHYHISPEKQWWSAPIAGLGVRYSLVLAIFTIVGTLINHRKLRYGPKLLSRHEWLMVAFLVVIWLSMLLGEPPERVSPTSVDIPAIKFAKVMVFALILTHVVTSVRSMNVVFYAVVIGVLYLAYKGYSAGAAGFSGGRLNIGVGGSDFGEANDYAVHLLACLPIIAVQTYLSGWKGRSLCLITGVLAVNSIVLARSRTAVVGLAGALLVALLLAPKKYRMVVLAGIIVFAIGAYSLTDPGFWGRASTITAEEAERDASAQSRLEIWEGGLKMFLDQPLGVGAGNFQKKIGSYAPEHPNRDAHSTYVLCLGELGVQGLLVYFLIVVSAIGLLLKVRSQCANLPAHIQVKLIMASYAVILSISVYVFCGLTINRLYTEGSWLFLAMPVCLWRAVVNAQNEVGSAAGKQDRRGSSQASAAIAPGGSR
ncbi:MAG TPA: O-antigen ligase family protein [Planctomycetota bacterium]|nr:O-antigen ligase family protein [Planctomycetota bacterium]